MVFYFRLFIIISFLSITDHVEFLGFRTDVYDILPAFDCFVLCSFSEGLSITLLEAMSSGLPIIATDVGGASEAIVSNNNGLLVKSNDDESLASAILLLASDANMRNRLGESAKITFDKNFSVENLAEKTASIYNSLIYKDAFHE